MFKDFHISLFDFISSLSEAIDLVIPELVNHPKQVSYIALSIAAEHGLKTDVQREMEITGLLHDVGALSQLSARMRLILKLKTAALLGSKLNQPPQKNTVRCSLMILKNEMKLSL